MANKKHNFYITDGLVDAMEDLAQELSRETGERVSLSALLRIAIRRLLKEYGKLPD